MKGSAYCLSNPFTRLRKAAQCDQPDMMVATCFYIYSACVPLIVSNKLLNVSDTRLVRAFLVSCFWCASESGAVAAAGSVGAVGAVVAATEANLLSAVRIYSLWSMKNGSNFNQRYWRCVHVHCVIIW